MTEPFSDLAPVFSGLQIFFLVVALLFLLTLMVVVWLGRSSLSWPRTKGMMLESEVRKIKRKPRYFIRTLYEYTVHQKTFRRRMMACGDFLTSYTNGYSQKKSDQYPSGKEVTVYYHPSKPGISVLEPGINPKVVNSLIFRMIILLICYLLVQPELLREILAFL